MPWRGGDHEKGRGEAPAEQIAELLQVEQLGYLHFVVPPSLRA